MITSATLKAVPFGGLINEDVMQKIWDISNIPLPVQDMISSGTHKNEFAEWTTDELAAPDVANAHVDGNPVTGDNTKSGARVGNHTQQSVKRVKVSSRAQSSDVIGQSNALAYQLTERQKELKRDIDAIMLLNQDSVADDGTLPGKSGGLEAWLKTNVSYGATGAAGGFNPSTGLVVARTLGTKRALSEATVRDICQAIYQAGGNPSVAMGRPVVIRKLSEYLFTSTAKVATLMSDQGKSREAAAALGAVNVFVTDFGVTLALTPNRLQQTTAAATSTLFIVDPAKLMRSDMSGIAVEPLAKDGTADSRLMSTDWLLKVLSEKAHGLIGDIDEALAVVA